MASLEYIFPDHSKRNHKIAIVVETTAAVAALALMFWAASTYWISPKQEPVANVPVDQLVEQRKVLEKPGPVVTLSPVEVLERRDILDKPGPEVKLTPEQLQQMKSVMENI